MIADTLFTAADIEYIKRRLPEVMEANLFTLRPLQSLLHPAANEVGRQRTILFHRRREHPPGVHRRFVILQDFQQRTGQDDHPNRRFGFGFRDVKFSLDKGCGLSDPQLPGFHIQVIPLQRQNFSQP